MVLPTPTATPLTAATIGLLHPTIAGRKRAAGRLSPPAVSAALRKSARSLPAVNAPGTPAISTQRTASDVLALSNASVIASYMAKVSAFFLSGRFIRMVRMPASSVTITCSVIRLSDCLSVECEGVGAFEHAGRKTRCRGGEIGRKEPRTRRGLRRMARSLSGKRILCQHAAAGRGREQPQVWRGAGERAERLTLDLAQQPGRCALERIHRFAQVASGCAERRVVAGFDRCDGVAQLAEIGAHGRAARERELAGDEDARLE